MKPPADDADQAEIRRFLIEASDDEIFAWARANNVDADALVGRKILRPETPQQRYVRERGKRYPEPGMIDHKEIKSGKLGELPSKLPCVECPVARASVPGQLGGYTAEQYLYILHSYADIACHLSPGFPKKLATQRSCTGVAMYRANCGVKAGGHAAEAIEHIGENTELSFANQSEFRTHHTGEHPLAFERRQLSSRLGKLTVESVAIEKRMVEIDKALNKTED